MARTSCGQMTFMSPRNLANMVLGSAQQDWKLRGLRSNSEPWQSSGGPDVTTLPVLAISGVYPAILGQANQLILIKDGCHRALILGGSRSAGRKPGYDGAEDNTFG